MNALIVVLAVSLLALVLVGLAIALGALERRSPRLSRWLDENVGQPGPWE